MAYKELIEFNPPEELHHKPVPTEVLPVFGIKRDAPQSDLRLAQVMLVGSKENGTWFVAAMDATEPRLETSFGGISIDDEPNADAERVLEIAEEWIRSSEATEWAPGSVLNLAGEDQVTDIAARGLILVRASDPSLRAEHSQPE
ncbi:MAG TPA: hypothetical protein VD947_00405 [Patescibacteria group bacterium]|nr:hypothetical protein [Patescibacteria group bacterium]